MLIPVSGMLCNHCKASVEKACKGVPGVVEAQADLGKQWVAVTGEFDVQAVEQAIADAGFEVVRQ